LTQARKVEVDGNAIRIERETDEGITTVEATLPAVLSVTEKINEPRYPSFKGIMAAKKKPVAKLTLAEAGIDAGEVGLANATSTVLEAAPKPPRAGGQRVDDEGSGGVRAAEFLIAQKLI
jgi:electron transfer flavoprotein beta subunit